MTFEQLKLLPQILEAVKSHGYVEPTPIQELAIPPLLEGKDLLGSAQTGTGKTAAFAIPILQKLTQQPPKRPKAIRALILTPTRELAAQIQESFRTYGKFLKMRSLVIFGGVGQAPQTDALSKGPEILVATPGRFLDLYGQGFIKLDGLEYFVLDEADRMLDMGFIHDVQKIIALLPAKRQTMLFSATMPKDVEEIARAILRDPIRIAVTPVETTVEAIDQFVYHVGKKSKNALLLSLLEDPSVVSALVFARTKHGANKIAEALQKSGVEAMAIHGNKSQSARTEAMGRFKAKKLRVLVATDIAARGIDIDHLSHVFNYDLPEVPETYIHRIGRTGRAGAAGIANSFCGEEEYGLLLDIEYHIGLKLTVKADHPFAIKPSLQKPAPKTVYRSAPSPKSRFRR